MQYHTLSLSSSGYDVHVLASPGAAPIQDLQQKPNVHLNYLSPPPAFVTKLPTVLSLAVKVIFQLVLMLWLMVVALPRPSAIIMQNPPAIPVMLLCWIASLRHRASFIIDWHNFAYTIMELKYGKYPWLIQLAKWHEQTMGRRAQYNFCVTKAMQRFLSEQFSIQAQVLYDRPPRFFQPANITDKHELLLRLGPTIASTTIGSCFQRYIPENPSLSVSAAAAGLPDGTSSSSTASSTFLTLARPGSTTPVPRYPRPALVISSTSWTPDEDFGMLLEAAMLYEAAASQQQQQEEQNEHVPSQQQQQQQQEEEQKEHVPSPQQQHHQYPDVLFIITGRGPQRDMYLNRLRQLNLKHVSFCSIWLESEDYPKILACADLGVCLHTSSSGLDLPMKVVDMYGAGLPVCAVDYPCIQELVKPGETGLLFKTPEQLAQQLQQLLLGFNTKEGAGGGGGGGGGEGEGKTLLQLREGVAATQLDWRWDENWQDVALPVFRAACKQEQGKKLA
jgi:beta-1,4-mannosyltransferase